MCVLMSGRVMSRGGQEGKRLNEGMKETRGNEREQRRDGGREREKWIGTKRREGKVGRRDISHTTEPTHMYIKIH